MQQSNEKRSKEDVKKTNSENRSADMGIDADRKVNGIKRENV
jgi:hypothetical protein